jgi:anti-sigma regulatory factor (Ser/Thr protein kinase)
MSDNERMTAKERILQLAKRQGNLKSGDLVPILKISRQAVAKHLKQLVDQGELTKTGSTREATYRLKGKKEDSASNILTLVKKLKGLQEDQVFEEVQVRLGLKQHLSQNVHSIASYAFTEMLNNAIDHSGSVQARIEIKIEKGVFHFSIEDAGIGIFENVRKGFRLENEIEAAHHVFKGKQTTMPSHHSGQGIFFTSRIADVFSVRSHQLEAVVDNEKQDFMIKDSRKKAGTVVQFSIKARSKKSLQTLFQEYANEDFEFDKNTVRVQLVGTELVSRSQAKRFLLGLEKFQRILLDFENVKGIGQAFADEIFRVFPKQHPGIQIDFINANSPIQFMIARAR